MEEIFSLLPTLLLIFFIFTRLSGFVKRIIEKAEKNNGDVSYEEPAVNREEDREEYVPAYEETADPGKEITADTDFLDSSVKDPDKKTDTVTAVEKNGIGRSIGQYGEQTGITASQQSRPAGSKGKAGQEDEVIFPEDNLAKEDIVRGIIFSEILGRPRARNPYKPPYLKL